MNLRVHLVKDIQNASKRLTYFLKVTDLPASSALLTFNVLNFELSWSTYDIDVFVSEFRENIFETNFIMLLSIPTFYYHLINLTSFNQNILEKISKYTALPLATRDSIFCVINN